MSSSERQVRFFILMSGERAVGGGILDTSYLYFQESHSKSI